ncbi:MAG: peptidylprolyl isomerase [Candidatus Geothermincolia bacterium]
MNRRLLIILAVLLVLVVSAIAIGGCGVSEKQESKSESKSTTPGSSPTTSPSQSQSAVLGPDGKPVKTLADFPDGQDGANVQGVIKTDKGDIVVNFFPDVAPVTVASFIHNARTGLYNGTTFHRVVPNFVIQGGDPKSKDPNAPDVGTGGPGYFLPLEPGNKPHLTGTLSMARSQPLNSGGSQFYICLAPQPSLDGQYTVFGEVASGMEVVNQIVQGDVIRSITIVPKAS